MFFRSVGALLFAVALVDTGYVLIRVWPTSPAMDAADIGAALAFNGLLFASFAAHHSVLARTRVKEWLRQTVPDAWQRTLYVVLASVLLLATMNGWRPIGHVLYTASAWVRPLLTLAQAAGVVLTLHAAWIIDVFELAGLRPPSNTRLAVRGAYRYVRHPIYLGFILIVWTPVAMTGDRLWFALLSTLYLVVAIPWEERSMRRAQGAPYDVYRAQVRWRIVPGLY